MRLVPRPGPGRVRGLPHPAPRALGTGVSEARHAGVRRENLQDFAAEYPDNWAQLWIAGGPETEGIDRMGMPAFGEQFSPEQLDSIVAYLESLP